MLKSIRIKGYKSLRDVSVRLAPLSVLFGPNASGKSNFLDALQLLSKLATCRTLKEAFELPYRGKPLESFAFGSDGIAGLMEQERLAFSFQADLHLSKSVVERVNQQIRSLRNPNFNQSTSKVHLLKKVRERYLRYRIEVEMRPASGILCISDEYLCALTSKGIPKRSRKPFIERNHDKIRVRLEGQGHPRYYDRYLNRSILSMHQYMPHHPHLEAARRELTSWFFYYFEPRERMRALNPVKEVQHIGLMGEDLAAFIRTLKVSRPRQFRAVENSLKLMIPSIDGIDVEVSNLGEVELRIRENGIAIPARVLSEGTLRILGLLALNGVRDKPSLVGIEEPENGIHMNRVELISELLKSGSDSGDTQYIATTHSEILLDMLPTEALLWVRQSGGTTRFSKIRQYEALFRPIAIQSGLNDSENSDSISDQIQ